jgi:hypothetical protein
MARTLDILDAALNGEVPPGSDPSAQQPGSQPQTSSQPSNSSDAKGQAKSGISATAAAATAAMRASRNEDGQKTDATVAKGDLQVKSRGGVSVAGQGHAYAQPPEARAITSSDWGKLPKKVADELTQGQRESVSSEYRNQVETYYRVIAEKSKKP